jgi:hypothetical protein
VRANGKDVHTITVQKVNLVGDNITTGSETVDVIASVPIQLSTAQIVLTNGAGSFEVGPSNRAGEGIITCKDSAENIQSGSLTLRFWSSEPPEDPELPVRTILGAELASMTVSTVTLGKAGRRSAVRSGQNNFDIVFTGTLSVDITAAGAGGLMQGLSEQPNTWYAVLLLADSTGANSSALMLVDEANLSSPTLPSGYDVWRRVFWVRNNGGSNFLQVIASGTGPSRRYHYDEPAGTLQVLSGQNATVFTPVSLASFVPPSVRNVLIGTQLSVTVNTHRAMLRPTGSSIATTPLILRPGVVSAGTSGYAEVVVNSNRSLDYKVDDSGDALTIIVLGYLDEL